MKKIFVLTIVFLVIGGMVVARGRRTPPRPAGAGRGQQRMIERIKAEHLELIKELEDIRELAKNENAEKTLKCVERVIARLEKKLADRLAAFRRRAAQSGRPAEDSGKKAADFTLKSFDGKIVKLSDYRGKIVVLEWFNYDCPLSRYHYASKNTMTELAKKYKDKGVVWLTINSTHNTKPQANIEFAKKHKITAPILDDRSGKVGKLYGAKTTPHMYIVNQRGNIVYEGAIDNAPNGNLQAGQKPVNYVDRALGELTGGKAVSLPATKPYGCSVKYAK